MSIHKSAILLLFLIKISSCNFGPGSYPYAEMYELSVAEPALVEAIQKFKEDNPKYIVPVEIQLSDRRKDESDHWYHVYFYYPEENQIVSSWTRPTMEGNTTFALVSINEGLSLGNWKLINRDYSRSENKKQIRKFEVKILNKIKEYL